MKTEGENWENLAKEVMINFYARAGVGRGNYDSLINFNKDLKNLVGFSLNCFQNDALPDPKNWNESELLMAENGKKHYSFDHNKECFVIKAIQASCKNDERNYVNVLPVLFLSGSTLFFTPLFRLRRHVKSKPHFVCAKGRIYEHFNDWEENNSLPKSCIFMYPTNGVLNGSNVSRKVQESSAASNVIGTAINIFETFGGPMGSVISSPLSAIVPIWEMLDRISHGESINPFTDKEAANLWINTTIKISGPFGKFLQILGISEFTSAEKKSLKSEKVSKESVRSLKSVLKGDKENVAQILNEAKSLLDNPMTIKDMMKVTEFYSETPMGCLKLSILLGFYMKTKFFYYNQNKLMLMKKLYKIALKIDEARSFRLTQSQEVIVGPIIISMKLLENFSCDDILKLADGLAFVKDDDQLSSHFKDIKDISKFFKTYPDFLTSLMMEMKYQMNKSHLNGKLINNDFKLSKDLKNIERLKFYINEDSLTMMNYHNQDYQIPKHDENISLRWLNIMKILEKRLLIFAKIINVIRCHSFTAISSGIIFQFTKHANDIINNLTTVNESSEVFQMLIFVYKILRKNFVPFTMKTSGCGRLVFSIGHGMKMHLNDLFNILQTDKSIDVLTAFCNLDKEEARIINEIRWNINNDPALVQWIVNSFKIFDTGLKMLIELRSDVLSDEFKSITQLFIPKNKHETNGLLLIKSGVYGFHISIHVLHEIDSDERMSIMKCFEHLQEREELMNAIGRVFKEKTVF